MFKKALVVIAGLALLATAAEASVKSGLKEGSPQLKSAGPLAFGPEGILFVADSRAASVFAIDTLDTAGDPSKAEFNIDQLDGKIAALLGTTSRDILINDLAVNPLSGNAYLSVSRGRGPDAVPVLLRADSSGKISEVSLEKVGFAKADLPNAPEDKLTGQGRRRRNKRLESITDMAYLDGRLIVAGLSNEEFASKLRMIPFPFTETDAGTSVEIFHGSHGRFETRSPVRTFVSFDVGGEPHLLAAYTCTPLVKFRVDQLNPGSKLQGTTVAELGNRNRPLDMIVYNKDGEDFLLMANSRRGVMKITTENLDQAEPITERVRDKAGQAYETIAQLEGVVQLDRLNDRSALVVVESEGESRLQSVPLP